MSLAILVDEDLRSPRLVGLLRTAGHDVRTVGEEDLMGKDDRLVIERAHELGCAVLTRNADDFRDLHDAGLRHSGILAVFEDRNPRKNMTRLDIARAIDNIDKAGVDLKGEFVSLNSWTY